MFNLDPGLTYGDRCTYVILHISKSETADPNTAYECQVLVMSQYKGGTAITHRMSNHSTPLLHHGDRGMSLGAGTPLTLKGRNVYSQGQWNIFTDIGQHSPPNQTLERKLDQMMEMITNTKQILVEQQSNQVIMGEKMEISSNVHFLQEEMKELQHNITTSNTNKRTIKISTNLSVSPPLS